MVSKSIICSANVVIFDAWIYLQFVLGNDLIFLICKFLNVVKQHEDMTKYIFAGIDLDCAGFYYRLKKATEKSNASEPS